MPPARGSNLAEPSGTCHRPAAAAATLLSHRAVVWSSASQTSQNTLSLCIHLLVLIFLLASLLLLVLAIFISIIALSPKRRCLR